MAFTYDLTTSRGQVRFLVPDNEATAYDLSDAEVDWFLANMGGTVNAAAIAACKWLARKYSKKASFSADGLSMQHGQRAAEFAKRAVELESELLGGVTSVPLERQDGYHDAGGGSEYEARTIYIRV